MAKGMTNKQRARDRARMEKMLDVLSDFQAKKAYYVIDKCIDELVEQFGELSEEEEKEISQALCRIHGLVQLDEMHRLLFSLLRSVEVDMEHSGVKVPKYVEHRVSEVKQDMQADYTPCRRCKFAVDQTRDEMGVYARCSAFNRADGTENLVCNSDGCSKGALRKEYQ